MDYNTMSAYYQKASKELESEDKKAVKAIADTALSSLNEGISNNTSNYDSAVKNAYAQAQTVMPTDTDTIRYGVNSNVQNVDRTLTRNRDNINSGLRTLKDVTEAQNLVNEAKIGSNYGKDRAKISYDIAKTQNEANRLAEQEEQTRKAQEGYLEQLNAISEANGYNYDFDSDIFNLKTQGYKDSDWQIMFLKEAKRLQTANRKATSTTSSSRGGNGGGKDIVSPLGQDNDVPLVETPSTHSASFNELKERIGNYLRTTTGATNRASILDNIQKRYNNGEITEEESNELISIVMPSISSQVDTKKLDNIRAFGGTGNR